MAGDRRDIIEILPAQRGGEFAVNKQFVPRVNLDRHGFRRRRVIPSVSEVQPALLDWNDGWRRDRGQRVFGGNFGGFEPGFHRNFFLCHFGGHAAMLVKLTAARKGQIKAEG